ncbi:organic cation transporter protein isoform X1 [Anthonomus grandis grandis]|uniref:organic cation transporter protein isoform X1 n=2 Tax=Anthonomus grandis grandis TaxID=2921223 RepID=UPI002165D032|nr:organic cation transporter protein isoform X1 [Anthonomus grandis grandis]
MDQTHDLDTLMGYMGDFGKYQAWQFFLHILSAATAGLNMLSLVTVAAVPDHRCQIPDEDDTVFNNTLLSDYMQYLPNGALDRCQYLNVTTNETVRCNSWVYDDTYYKSSRAIEWNFVCDQRWMGAVAQSMYMFGVFTGAVTLGNMADKYGRKPVFCWSAVLQVVIGVGVAFSPNYYSFIITKFLHGIFGSAGSYIPGFVLTMELVGSSKRSMCGIAFQAVFAFGIMLVAAWGALIKDRVLLQVIYGCHAIILLGHFWLMDESPRWLWANGRKKEAVNIITKALKMNNSSVSVDPTSFLDKNPEVQKQEQPEEAGMLDLFRQPRLRKMALNVCLAWFANSLVYYGLSLNTGSLQGNPYLILFVMGMVELPSYVLTVYIMDRLGRRSITSFNMIVGSICCILAANLAAGSSLSNWFVFIGKFLIASSFAVVYNYSAELFPTVIRNSAMGLGSMCARLSGALTPLIMLFDSFDPKLPSNIFAVIALVSGFLTLFLPETLDKAMPQTIEDGENFGVGDTCFTTCLGKKQKQELEGVTPNELEPLKA